MLTQLSENAIHWNTIEGQQPCSHVDPTANVSDLQSYVRSCRIVPRMYVKCELKEKPYKLSGLPLRKPYRQLRLFHLLR